MESLVWCGFDLSIRLLKPDFNVTYDIMQAQTDFDIKQNQNVTEEMKAVTRMYKVKHTGNTSEEATKTIKISDVQCSSNFNLTSEWPSVGNYSFSDHTKEYYNICRNISDISIILNNLQCEYSGSKEVNQSWGLFVKNKEDYFDTFITNKLYDPDYQYLRVPEKKRHAFIIIHIGFTIFISVVGFLGNGVVLVVMLSERNSSATSLFRSLAQADIWYLFHRSLLNISYTSYCCTYLYRSIRHWDPYIFICMNIFSKSGHLTTTWILVLAILERYGDLCRSHYQTTSVSKRTALFAMCVPVICIPVTLLRLYEHEANIHEECGQSFFLWNIKELDLYNWYWGCLFMQLHVVFPSSVLIYCTIRSTLIIRKFKHVISRNGRAVTDHKMAVILTSLFLITHIPYSIWWLFSKSTFLPHNHNIHVDIITNSFIPIFSSVKFFVYCVIDKTFRKQLKKLIYHVRKRGVEDELPQIVKHKRKGKRGLQRHKRIVFK